MRIAWFTPFSRTSAIGRYSALVLAELSRRHEVVVYASDLKRAAGFIPAEVRRDEPGGSPIPVRPLIGQAPADVVRSLEQADLAVYNLGNHFAYHRDIHAIQLLRPGVVILHDLALYDFFTHLALLDRNCHDTFVEQLAFSHGEAGRLLAHRVLIQRRHTREMTPEPLAFPMIRSATHRALGVIVHGEYQRAALAPHAAVPVAHIDFPRPELPLAEAPARTGGRARVLTFGTAVANKQIHTVIEALATSEELRRAAEYHVLGEWPEPAYEREVRALVASRGVGDIVHLHGRVSDAALREALSQADVVVNLRVPHCGEASWSLLESLFAGKPTLVWPHGYYDDFPEGVVCKVDSLARLRGALEGLCASRARREEVGRAARAYAEGRFDTARYGRAFDEFAARCLQLGPAMGLIDAVSERLRELAGRDADGPLARRVSGALAAWLGAA